MKGAIAAKLGPTAELVVRSHGNGPIKRFRSSSVRDLVFDPIPTSVNRENMVPVSQPSMSHLRGRVRDNLSDRLQTEQNTKVFYRGCP